MLTSWDVLDIQRSFVEVFFDTSRSFFFPSQPPAFQSHTLAQDSTSTYLYANTPSRLKCEPGGVSSISAQRAERPHDEFEASVVNVPQVDVFMRDLHGALPIDVQVRGGH